MITSRDNKIFKSFKRLNHKKFRDREGLFVIEGDKLVHEAKDIEIIAVREDRALDYADAHVFTDALFEEMAGTVNSQGVMAIVKKPVLPENIGRGNIVVMDRIQDPGNAGTIIRTSDAAGVAAVIAVKGTCDVYSPKVVRSCAGSIFRIPVFEMETDEAIRALEHSGKTIVSSCPRDATDMRKLHIDGDMALVVGNEAGGVSDAFLEHSSFRTRIPMKGDIESLNASVACGILIYELLY